MKDDDTETTPRGPTTDPGSGAAAPLPATVRPCGLCTRRPTAAPGPGGVEPSVSKVRGSHVSLETSAGTCSRVTSEGPARRPSIPTLPVFVFLRSSVPERDVGWVTKFRFRG